MNIVPEGGPPGAARCMGHGPLQALPPRAPNSSAVLVCTMHAPCFPEGSWSHSAAGDTEHQATKSPHRRVALTHMHLVACSSWAAVKPQRGLIALCAISRLSSRARSVAPRSLKRFVSLYTLEHSHRSGSCRQVLTCQKREKNGPCAKRYAGFCSTACPGRTPLMRILSSASSC